MQCSLDRFPGALPELSVRYIQKHPVAGGERQDAAEPFRIQLRVRSTGGRESAGRKAGAAAAAGSRADKKKDAAYPAEEISIIVVAGRRGGRVIAHSPREMDCGGSVLNRVRFSGSLRPWRRGQPEKSRLFLRFPTFTADFSFRVLTNFTPGEKKRRKSTWEFPNYTRVDGTFPTDSGGFLPVKTDDSSEIFQNRILLYFFFMKLRPGTVPTTIHHSHYFPPRFIFCHTLINW